MDTEIQVILEQNKRMGDRMDNLTQLVDKDRSQLDQNTIDISSIKKGQEAILNQMADMKQELRQELRDVIREELPRAIKKAVAKEFELIEKKNPNKKLVRKNFWKRIFK